MKDKIARRYGACASNLTLSSATVIDEKKGLWKVQEKSQVSYWDANRFSIDYLREYFPKAVIRRVQSKFPAKKYTP